jgi:hypothetical protein
MPDQRTPAAQAKALRLVAVSLLLAGLFAGIGFPVILYVMKIEIAMTASGFDWIWVPLLALMAIDFVLAAYFWRRAEAIESNTPPA